MFQCSLAQVDTTEKSKLDLGELHGNFQFDAQYYNKDTTIGAPIVPEKMLAAGFFNLVYSRNNFSAGARFESYNNALQGFDKRYQGNGFPYKFISYDKYGLKVTAGNFYEQFGSGLILRAYEERNLGYDNVFEGVNVRYKPYKGVNIKALVGKQRLFFAHGPGIVRGIDGEFNITEAIDSLNPKLVISIGGSFVSKYQKDEDPIFKLPENVSSWAARAKFGYGNFTMTAEFVSKINDPSYVNNFIYKQGHAALVNLNYSVGNFTSSVNLKRIDNMNFRSDRNETGNNLNINYLPSTTKPHTYALAATIYPYATQLNGEMGLQADLAYRFERGTAIGGPYGMEIAVNYSNMHGLDSSKVIPDLGYESDFFKLGKRKYFQDFNVEISRKFSTKFKLTATYLNFFYDKDVIQGLAGYGIVKSNIGILEASYKIKPKHNIRVEAQYLSTKNDLGSWAMGLIEYTIAPKWFFAIFDQYNLGNPSPSKRIHYFTGSMGYTYGNYRILMSYGRQRAGIFCVGGVCRNVPASNGLTLTIYSNF